MEYDILKPRTDTILLTLTQVLLAPRLGMFFGLFGPADLGISFVTYAITGLIFHYLVTCAFLNYYYTQMLRGSKLPQHIRLPSTTLNIMFFLSLLTLASTIAVEFLPPAEDILRMIPSILVPTGFMQYAGIPRLFHVIHYFLILGYWYLLSTVFIRFWSLIKQKVTKGTV